MPDWKRQRMVIQQDMDGTEGLHALLEGMGDTDHGLRIYGPADEQESRLLLEVIAELWNGRLALAGLSPRPTHLKWSGDEWYDERCAADPPCRYHPDDTNGTHGGGAHVHACSEHSQELKP